jgi:hypothetical protein
LVTHAGDHAAAFALVKTDGAEGACAIVRRALRDESVLSKNCTLRYIASKPESFRGAVPAKVNGRHMVQPGPAGGGRAPRSSRMKLGGGREVCSDALT